MRMELADQRRMVTELLRPLELPVRIRAIGDYDELDDSCLYAENGDREFVVSLIEGVTWGPGIDHFVELKGEFRPMERLDVSVPNDLEAHLPQIKQLFADWFTSEEG